MIPKGRVHVEDYPGRYNHHAMAYDPAAQPPSSLSLPYSCLGPHLCCAFPWTPPYPLGENLQIP